VKNILISKILIRNAVEIQLCRSSVFNSYIPLITIHGGIADTSQIFLRDNRILLK
jgi:hypothetical protein